MPSLFVSIANYRDSETPHTVADLFAQAAHPERLRVGVLSQVVPGTDDDCVVPAHPQVTELRVHASQSRGACWARHVILTQLRHDEAFVLQIDSHSRFVERWDERFIDMLAQCPSPRALLSSYPVAYRPPRELGEPIIPVHVPKAFGQDGILTFKSHTLSYAQRPAQPIASPFIGAGCLFGPAGAFDEVPYDPHLYFIGEEVTLSARLWTHGWDVFAPNDVLMYHDYTQGRGRPKHWEDHRNWTVLNERARSRVHALLAGVPSVDPAAVQELDRYGLGSMRLLTDYEQHAAVFFKARQIGARWAADKL